MAVLYSRSRRNCASRLYAVLGDARDLAQDRLDAEISIRQEAGHFCFALARLDFSRARRQTNRR